MFQMIGMAASPSFSFLEWLPRLVAANHNRLVRRDLTPSKEALGNRGLEQL